MAVASGQHDYKDRAKSPPDQSAEKFAHRLLAHPPETGSRPPTSRDKRGGRVRGADIAPRSWGELPVASHGTLRIESSCFAPLLTGIVARNLMRTGFVYRQQADKRARRARAAIAGPLPPLAAHAGDAAPPPAAGVCLWLWPDAVSPQLAEVAPAPGAGDAAVQVALACCAERGVTPVVLPPGRPSFVRRLLALDSLPARAEAGQRALAAGDIASAADADLASVLGGACPPWSGGVISFHDTEIAR